MSAVAFVYKARKLAVYVVGVVDRLENHAFNIFGKHMADDAVIALQKTQEAQRIYPTDKTDFKKRARLFNTALGRLDHLEALALMLRDYLKPKRKQKMAVYNDKCAQAAAEGKDPVKIKKPKVGPTDKELAILAEKITEEREIIKGVKKSDQRRKSKLGKGNEEQEIVQERLL